MEADIEDFLFFMKSLNIGFNKTNLKTKHSFLHCGLRKVLK